MARSASVRMATTTINRRKPGRPKGSTNKVFSASKVPTAEAATIRRKPGRPKGSTNKVAAKSKPLSRSSQRTPRVAVAKATKPVRLAAPVARAEAVPKMSKDELRAQVQKLTTSVATLRAKLREATKAAKLAASRITDLEEQVTQRDRNAAPAGPEDDRSGKVTRPRGTRGKTTSHDPGGAVSPSDTVEGSLPVDDEAEAA